METMNFLTLFIINVAMLWIFLAVAYAYQTNPRILEKKGYGAEYRAFIQKDSRSRILGIALVVPLLEVLAGLLVWLVAGELSVSRHLHYVLFVFVLLVIPFPIMDMKVTGKKYRDLAVKTNAEILVDLNYRTLHRIFKPALEIAALVPYLVFFALYVKALHPAFIHLLIPWFLYYSARSSKYLTRPGLKGAYLSLFGFMVANHVIAGLHLVKEIADHCCLKTAGYVLGIATLLLLVAKLGIYLHNFPQFKRDISAAAPKDTKTDKSGA